MKSIQTLTLLMTAIFLIPACDKDDDYVAPPLPYFYCKINGQNFAARGGGGCQSRVFNYYPNGFMNITAGSVILQGNDCQNFSSVGLNLKGFNMSMDTIFLLDTNDIDSCRAYYSFNSEVSGNYVIIDTIFSGYIKFEQFSDKQGEQNGIVSGTFEFTVRNEELDSTVTITEGRFQYIIDYEWY